MKHKAGKRKKKHIVKKKRALFRRPHPVKRKIVVKQRRLKMYFQKHNPKVFFFKGVRKLVGGFYTVSDKVRDKIAESNMTLNNPFSFQFYEDRCIII